MSVFDVEVEDTNFDVIPEGKYIAELANCEGKTSKAGNDYLNLQWKLVDNDKYNGRYVFGKIMFHEGLSDAAARLYAGQIEKLGFTRDERKEQAGIDIGTMQVLYSDKAQGNKYELSVTVEEAQGDFAEKNGSLINKKLGASDLSL